MVLGDVWIDVSRGPYKREAGAQKRCYGEQHTGRGLKFMGSVQTLGRAKKWLLPTSSKQSQPY
jgi:hypothetical protein